MNIADDYLPDRRFDRLADHLTSILTARSRTLFRIGFGNDFELFDSLHVALRGAGVDMGDIELNREAKRIEPTKRIELVTALTELQPSPVSGAFDRCDVVFTLANVGSVFPASVQPMAEAA